MDAKSLSAIGLYHAQAAATGARSLPYEGGKQTQKAEP